MAFDDDRTRDQRGRPMAGMGSSDRPGARGYGSGSEGRPSAFSSDPRSGGGWQGGVWRDPATPDTWNDAPSRGDWGHQGGATMGGSMGHSMGGSMGGSMGSAMGAGLGDYDQGRVSSMGGAGMSGGHDPYARGGGHRDESRQRAGEYGEYGGYGGGPYGESGRLTESFSRGEQGVYGERAGLPGSGAYGGGIQGESYGYGSGALSGRTSATRKGPKNWQRSDERIREDVCDRLAQLQDVDPSEVEVAVSGGCVTLSGTVPDRTMKHRIEDCADACPGVTEVDNHLRVRRARDMSSRGGLLGRLFGFSAGADAGDVMTPDPMVVAPSDTVEKAARLMLDADVGAVPVCAGLQLRGMLTDRDIAVRVVAAGRQASQTKVSEVMSSDVFCCTSDDDIDDVLEQMGDRQVRRIPVVDRESRNLVGIVSLGDVATATGKHTDDALQAISSEGHASGSSDTSTSGGTRVRVGSSAGLSSGTTSGVNSGI